MTLQVIGPEIKLVMFQAWIAFIALSNFGIGLRSFVEDSNVFSKLTEGNNNSDAAKLRGEVLAHATGMFALLRAIILVHSVLFIRCKPVVTITVCALSLTMLFDLSEAYIYRSLSNRVPVIVPCVLNAITVVGLLIIPKEWLNDEEAEDENKELANKFVRVVRFKRRVVNKEVD